VSGGILGYLLRAGFVLVVGPIFGGLAFVIGATLAGFPHALALVIMLPFFLIGCYVAGWKAALLTGVVISVIGPQVGSRRTIVVISTVIGALASHLLPPGEGFVENGGLLAFTGAGAAAAAACAWLLDRLKLMRPGVLLSA
jgi:hypothetical protein